MAKLGSGEAGAERAAVSSCPCMCSSEDSELETGVSQETSESENGDCGQFTGPVGWGMMSLSGRSRSLMRSEMLILPLLGWAGYGQGTFSVPVGLVGELVAGALLIPCWIVLAHRMVLRRSSWLNLSPLRPRPVLADEPWACRVARTLSSRSTFLKTFHSRNRLSYMRLLSGRSVSRMRVMVKAGRGLRVETA